MQKQLKPYGAWESEISGETLVQGSLRLGQLCIDQDKVLWTEGRPSEKGRTALMACSLAGGSQEISSPDQDVRTRAHEYGGGAFISNQGRCFLVENKDQQLYELREDGLSRKITSNETFRYADPILDASRNVIYCVGEDHADPTNIINCLLRIDLNDGGQQVIAFGHDFYSNPRLSPDGTQLLFLSWDHPNMPWDGTELCLVDLDSGGNMANIRSIAGGPKESVFQPQWDSNGSIYYVSDKNGWWNIYQYADNSSRCLLEMDAEFGLPQWVFGMSTYAVLSSGKLIASYKDPSGSHLIRIEVESGETEHIDVPYREIDQLHGFGERIAFIGSSPNFPSRIISMDLNSGAESILQQASEVDLDFESLSIPESITFDSRSGESAYAWYYSPTNPNFEAPKDEKPLLIVLSHGGPTAYSSPSFSLAIQYWTSRGFAVADVNYSGSTGYGRAYRERLNGNWGLRDVEDCSAAAVHLANQGLVDKDRLIIKGGSAGGYTTLAALAFKNIFKAGASYYGVGDLTRLAGDTHKFESRYLDRLVGKYPEDAAIYQERSPINHTDQLDCPVIFLQGLDDKVVPPNQAETMFHALQEKGIPVAYVPFEGESHGFRQASTLIRAIESEFYFYSRIFNFEPAEDLEEIEILNL